MTSTPPQKTKKYIDIKEVLASKSKTLVRWMPGFVLRFIKRLLHEDDINDLMSRIGHLQGGEFLEGVLRELNATLVVKGAENVPRTGGVIIAANHPLGGLDGMALMKAVGDIRSDFQFLVNDVLLNIKNLEMLFVPVNKVGENPRKATRIIEQTYARDIAVLVFPAGLVSRQQPGGIADLEWKKSFVVRAKKYQKDIIPVHIEGRNSRFFYKFSSWRRRLGIKANLEMILLAHEMFNQRDETLTIRFGKPVPWTSLDDRKSPQEWANELRQKAYNLPNEI